ncbi:unnamed protein product [Peronospora destructor]|uniref:Reverse transcriptase zinc-binding domain-containing protein n=1 Tax=Peronospora destructor TaxID=86335 RepID=A0AAV0TU48_9STRA|nr:unnamed protein product [Peronospora destructor]
MSACDITASRASGTTVHFGAHPTLTRVVHLVTAFRSGIGQPTICLAPSPECPPAIPAMANHVLWTCPSARRHWEYLLDWWRMIGDLKDADLNVWVFGMDITGIPSAAWDAIKHAIEPSLALSRAKDAVFQAAREQWRFVVSTTLHAIWTERLRRMEDSSLPAGGTHSKGQDPISKSGSTVSRINIPAWHGGRTTPVRTSAVGAYRYSPLLR